VDALIVSRAKDTNGGNARFVAAARRHRGDDDVLTALAIGRADPAGVMGRFKVAADKTSTLKIRSVAMRDASYLQFPPDLIWGEDNATIWQLARDADIIHYNNTTVAARRLGLPRKPGVLHHHGTLFRSNPGYGLAEAKRMRLVSAVSTLDLTRFDEDVLRWLPAPYDISALRAFGEANRRPPDGLVRIFHSPTNRAFKGTDVFIAAVKHVARYLPVELIVMEGKSNAEVLAAKATADIVFDQLTWGYGCNAIEAWGMGIPVISGSDEWTARRMRDEFGGTLPFAVASEDTLVEVIAAMVESADMRAEYAERGYDHVLEYHDEQPALARLAELYHDALGLWEWSRASVPAVTFRNTGERPVRAAGETIVPGLNEVTDPDVIKRLRYLSRRSVFAIEEVAG
jgi:hypothetical protein